MKLKDKKIRVLHDVSGNTGGWGEHDWRSIHDGWLWAYYRYLSGNEHYASATINETEEVVFYINWRNNVDTDMIIEYNGKFYDITRIDDFEGYKNDLSIYAKLHTEQNIIVNEPEA
jgi:SPP1 family predicted phage head-tail adaptor